MVSLPDASGSDTPKKLKIGRAVKTQMKLESVTPIDRLLNQRGF